MLRPVDILGNHAQLPTGDIRWSNPTKNRRFWQPILMGERLWNEGTGRAKRLRAIAERDGHASSNSSRGANLEHARFRQVKARYIVPLPVTENCAVSLFFVGFGEQGTQTVEAAFPKS